MAITDTNVVACTCSTVVGIVFKLLIYWRNDKLPAVLLSLRPIADRYVTWAYSEQRTVPRFATPAHAVVTVSRLPFCTLLNQHVLVDGPTRHVRVFRYGIQALYSGIKGGVDAADQIRSVLNCSGISVGWEQKQLLYSMNTQMENCFISWRLMQWEHYLNSSDDFR